jgi:leucine dehydrogenase
MGTTRRDELNFSGFEKVVYCEVPSAKLASIIAIHSTNLGAACGGIRMLPYASKQEALNDVLRLARGMSYKSALANIGFGGGKAVILSDPKRKSPELFHAFGEFVESFQGQYIAAKDMNIDAPDLKLVKERTEHVLGIEGLPTSGGDPSPITARGLLRALHATSEALGAKSLSGIRVAIQGIGHVGYAFAEKIKEEGGSLWVTDIDPRLVETAKKELGAIEAPGDKIYDVECDVFSPCALGAILNPSTIQRLKCRAVVGSANNQLESESDGFRLHERGILYAPDYAVNSGGIINIFVEYEGYDIERALAKADGIYDTIKEIFRRAELQKTAPHLVASELAEERLYGK